jgi:hypothetical protein
VQIELVADSLQLRLSWWQKALGLMRNVTVPLRDVESVAVEPDPVRVAPGISLEISGAGPLRRLLVSTSRAEQLAGEIEAARSSH